MEQEIAQAAMGRIRAAAAAFNDGDFDTAFAGLAPEVEWHFGAWVFDSPVLHGRDAVIAYYTRLRQEAGV